MSRVQSIAISAIVFAIIGFLVAVLTGTSKKHHLGDKDCQGAASCNVSVSFDCTLGSPVYFNCSVDVDYAMTRQKKNKDVTWQIADPHFEFDTKNGADIGIVFNDSTSGFKCTSNGKQQITCNSSESGVWQYTINVKGLDPFDPWVYQP